MYGLGVGQYRLYRRNGSATKICGPRHEVEAGPLAHHLAARVALQAGRAAGGGNWCAGVSGVRQGAGRRHSKWECGQTGIKVLNPRSKAAVALSKRTEQTQHSTAQHSTASDRPAARQAVRTRLYRSSKYTAPQWLTWISRSSSVTWAKGAKFS